MAVQHYECTKCHERHFFYVYHTHKVRQKDLDLMQSVISSVRFFFGGVEDGILGRYLVGYR